MYFLSKSSRKENRIPAGLIILFSSPANWDLRMWQVRIAKLYAKTQNGQSDMDSLICIWLTNTCHGTPCTPPHWASTSSKIPGPRRKSYCCSRIGEDSFQWVSHGTKSNPRDIFVGLRNLSQNGYEYHISSKYITKWIVEKHERHTERKKLWTNTTYKQMIKN